ncbi:MAG: hypothetical protein ACFCAD_06875 [Pleurocapsa sp.]
MNTIFRKLLTLTCLTTAGIIASTQNAQAFNFSLDPASDIANGEFKYDLELDAGESISDANPILADYLTLTNFSGAAVASSPYVLIGSSSTSANFEIGSGNTTSGAITLDDVVTITSSNFMVGTINYDLTYSGGTVNSTITGPVAVPFGTSTNSANLILSGIFGVNYLRGKRKAKNNVDFS